MHGALKGKRHVHVRTKYASNLQQARLYCRWQYHHTLLFFLGLSIGLVFNQYFDFFSLFATVLACNCLPKSFADLLSRIYDCGTSPSERVLLNLLYVYLYYRNRIMSLYRLYVESTGIPDTAESAWVIQDCEVIKRWQFKAHSRSLLYLYVHKKVLFLLLFTTVLFKIINFLSEKKIIIK